MSNWVSLRAYARHRGDALSAVQKAIRDNRVSAAAVRRDGTDRCTGIDQEQADRDWALNTDPGQAAKNGKNPSALVVAPAADEATTAHGGVSIPRDEGRQAEGTGEGHHTPRVPGQLELGDSADTSAPAPAVDSTKDPHGYLAARAAREGYQAKVAELDYLERVGELVSAAEVRAGQFDVYRQLRDKLEQIPTSVSERVAAESDPQRIEHVLRTEIRKTLNELSRALAIDAAAGGVEERATATV